MLKYKVDWLAFSVSFEEEEQTLDTKILELLGHNLAIWQILMKYPADIFTILEQLLKTM